MKNKRSLTEENGRKKMNNKSPESINKLFQTQQFFKTKTELRIPGPGAYDLAQKIIRSNKGVPFAKSIR
jgi:hypothetical protein